MYLLFNSSEFDPLQCPDSEEFWLEKYDIFIVASSSPVVWPSRQGIRLFHRLSGVVAESKVKASKVQKLVSLTTVEFF